jgi:hypothetical protein
MILIKGEIEGESDVPPFTRFFEYREKLDEQIFFDSLEIIKDKVAKNLRITQTNR